MSHLLIFKKKSADYHRFFYLCLSLEIGEKYRLVGIRLKAGFGRKGHNYRWIGLTKNRDIQGAVPIPG